MVSASSTTAARPPGGFDRLNHRGTPHQRGFDRLNHRRSQRRTRRWARRDPGPPTPAVEPVETPDPNPSPAVEPVETPDPQPDVVSTGSTTVTSSPPRHPHHRGFDRLLLYDSPRGGAAPPPTWFDRLNHRQSQGQPPPHVHRGGFDKLNHRETGPAPAEPVEAPNPQPGGGPVETPDPEPLPSGGPVETPDSQPQSGGRACRDPGPRPRRGFGRLNHRQSQAQPPPHVHQRGFDRLNHRDA